MLLGKIKDGTFKIKFTIFYIILLIGIVFTSVGYAAMNTSMQVSGEAIVRVNSNIRVTGLEFVGSESGGTEQYNSKYSKDTTTFGIKLPNVGSKIKYNVTITNKGNIDQTVYQILKESISNSNVKFTIDGYNEKDIIAAGESKTFKITFTSDIASSDIINIVLKYDFRKVYKVDYDANGGTNAPDSQIKYENENLVLTSTVPEKKGYIFRGWTDEKDSTTVKYKSGSTYTQNNNIYLFAIWETYNCDLELSFNVDGTTYKSGYNNRIQIGLKIDGVDKGYIDEFSGTFKYGTEYEIYGIKLDGTTISYSKNYKVDGTNYLGNIKFNNVDIKVNNSEYGKVSNSNLLVMSGSTFIVSQKVITLSDGRIITADTVNKTGYTTKFVNYTYVPNSTTIQNKTTITANFERTINQYTLTIDPNGGAYNNSSKISTIVQDYATTKEVDNPSSTPYYTLTYNANGTGITMPSSQNVYRAFTGWTLSGSGSFSGKTYTYSDGDGKLTANYNSTSNSVSLPALSKTGYTCKWSTSPSGGTGYKPGASIKLSSNTTLYAQCTVNTYTNTINHWAGGFKNQEGNSVDKSYYLLKQTNFTKKYGESYKLGSDNAVAIPNGYGFVTQHYSTPSIEGSLNYYPFTTNITQSSSSINYSFYYEPITYNITYNLDGGTNDSSNPTTYNVLYGVSFNNPSKTGYTFSGWNNGEDLLADSKTTYFTNATIDGNKMTFTNVVSGNKFNCFQLQLFTTNYDYIRTIFQSYNTGNVNGVYTHENDTGYYIIRVKANGNAADAFYYNTNIYLEKGKTYSINCLIDLLDSSKIVVRNLKLQPTVTGINEGKNATFTSSDDLYDQLSKRTTGDKTITANWIANSYVLTINPNNGEESYIQVQNYGTKYTVTTPTRVGYTFNGWTLSGKGSMSGTTYTYGDGAGTLTANWTANTYTIKYNANGGSGTMEQSTATYNQSASISSNTFTRQGYVFAGWTTNSDGTDDGYGWTNWSGTWKYVNGQFGVSNGILNLYARWTAQKLTIVYNKNDGSGAKSSETFTWDGNMDDNKYSPPTSYNSRTGYTFAGWSNKSDGSDNARYPFNDIVGTNWFLNRVGSNATATTNIYAIWNLNTYTISYNLNGGTVSKANPTSYNVTSAAFTLNNPSKTGYTFTGWTGSNGTTPSKTVTISQGSTGNRSYTANWTANTNTPYKVIHQKMNVSGSGYTVEETENLTGTTGASITPAVKTYTGFTSPSTQTTTIAANGSTVVTYKYARNKYAYTLGSGTGVSTSGSTGSGSYYYGATITLKASGSTGYTWSKWTSSNTNLVASTATANTSFKMPAGAITMTPSATLNTYTISYNLNGGTLGSSNPTSYNVTSATFTLNNPSKTGYTFTGWTGSNGTTAQKTVTISKGSTGNRSYTANWTANTYAISYNKGDATGGTLPNNQTATYDQSITLGTNNMTKSNSNLGTVTFNYNGCRSNTTSTAYRTYAANGWATSSNGSKAYNSGASFTWTRTSGLTLYPSWASTDHSATFPSPTCTGYTFAGWYTAASGGSKVTSYTGTSNVTYYAHWNINSYTLTVNPNGGTWNSSTSSQTFTQNYATTKAIANPTATPTYTISYNANSQGASYTGSPTSVSRPFTGWSLSGSGSISGTTYTYGAGNGTLTASYSGTSNSFTLPAISKTGYSCVWRKGSASGTAYSGGTSVTVTGNTTYYASCTIKSYTLTVNPNGGTWNSSTSSQTFTQNYATTKTIANPTATPTYTISYNANSQGASYTGSPTSVSRPFTGWSLSGSGSISGTTYTYGAGNGTLTASYSGTSNSFTLPAISKTGYSCVWKKGSASGTAYSGGTSVTVTGNTTYYASCTINSYTLTVNPNGGTWSGSTSNQTFTQNYGTQKTISNPSALPSYSISYNANGTGITMPSATTAYRSFTGWTLSGYGSLSGTTYTYGAGNGTLTAGYNSTSNSVSLPALSKTGYTCKWATASSGGTTYSPGDAIKVSSNTTMYARCAIITYTISYNLNGGTVSKANPTSYNVTSAAFTLNNPSKTGYTFTGWTGSNGTTPGKTVTISQGSTGNRSYTANFTANTNTAYKVVHNLMNVSGSGYTAYETQNLTGTTGASITPAVKTYTGFTSPSTQTTTIAANGSTVVNYYYTRNKYTYTLGSGTGVSTSGSTASGSYYYGTTITITASANRGYTWSKWTSSNTGLVGSTTTASTSFSMPAGNITMTPSATLNTYTISYTLNGGSATNPTSYNVNTATFTLNNPSKTGYTFTGWTGSNGTTPSKTVTISKGSTGNRSYTANFTANTNTAYKVVHYQMNVSGSGYTAVETQNLTGTTGASITPSVKAYTGFTSPSTQTTSIAADGSTVVSYYYTRNKYTFTLGSTTGITTTGSTGSGTYYYGTTITLKSERLRGSWTKGWTSSNTGLVASTSNANTTFSMPAGNITMTPARGKYICVRSTKAKLHKQKCTRSSGGCRNDGFALNQEITYGQNYVTKNDLIPGDAFDCDINGDNEYDPETERFYFVSKYYIDQKTNKESYNTDEAGFTDYVNVLIYYKNTNKAAYDSSNVNYYGPRTAAPYLPSWTGVSIFLADKQTMRKIVNNESKYTTNSGKNTISNQVKYTSTRFLTFQELTNGLNITGGSDGEINYAYNGNFVLENTDYASTSSLGYWLETPASNTSSVVYTVSGNYRKINKAYANSTNYSIRPVIDVHQNYIDLTVWD